MTALLSVENLDVSFGEKKVVAGVSFSLDKGETLAVVGESGSGKTMSALSILKLLPGNARTSGKISLQGREISTLPENDLNGIRSNRISIIFQEPLTSLNPLHPIGKQVEEVILLHQNVTKEVAAALAKETLEKVGLKEVPYSSLPHELSGGQRQRVMIAIAVANRPDVLIADEPTTALDVTIQAQILDLLKTLQKETGLSILFITHDLSLVKRFADRVVVMKDGNIVEEGRTDQVLQTPKHAYTKHLLDCIPHTAAEPFSKEGKAPILSVRDLSVFYRNGAFCAVNKGSFDLFPGETLAVVGESGSGKTTLAQAVLRLVKAREGSVLFQGTDVLKTAGKQLRALRCNAGIVFQDPFSSLNPRLSVEEIVSEGLLVHQPHLSKRDVREKCRETLEKVELSGDVLFRYPHEFSGGQRQRIALARALILNPAVIVLDEPTSALDVSIQSKMVALFQKLQRDIGISYLFISHDMRLVRSFAHNVVVMKNGFIVESGTCRDIFANPRHPYTKQLKAAAFDHG